MEADSAAGLFGFAVALMLPKSMLCASERVPGISPTVTVKRLDACLPDDTLDVTDVSDDHTELSHLDMPD